MQTVAACLCGFRECEYFAASPVVCNNSLKAVGTLAPSAQEMRANERSHLCNQAALGQILAPLVRTCVTLGTFLNLSMVEFLHL